MRVPRFPLCPYGLYITLALVLVGVPMNQGGGNQGRALLLPLAADMIKFINIIIFHHREAITDYSSFCKQ
jgi:hypothetical protein